MASLGHSELTNHRTHDKYCTYLTSQKKSDFHSTCCPQVVNNHQQVSEIVPMCPGDPWAADGLMYKLHAISLYRDQRMGRLAKLPTGWWSVWSYSVYNSGADPFLVIDWHICQVISNKRYYHVFFMLSLSIVPVVIRVYGSGHQTAAVLLPGFAINW